MRGLGRGRGGEGLHESPMKGHNYNLLPQIFSKFSAFGMRQPLPNPPRPAEQHVVLKVLTENKVFYFSKRALCADITPNFSKFSAFGMRHPSPTPPAP